MKRFILATAIVLSASNTIALENNFYLKSTYGAVDTDISTQKLQGLNIPDNLSNPKGWSFTLGYQLNNYIALEGGFVDLGDAEGREYDIVAVDYDDIFARNFKKTINTQTQIVGLFFSTNINRDFYAGIRTGYQFWDEHFQTKWESNYLNQSGKITGTFEGSYHRTNNGSDPYYGISAGWNYINWSLSLEHTIFEMEERKPNFSSLALTYNF
ncbi:hypothetical protein [Microbulbifer sp. JMSA008]|uniref:hypothetical protein n=1 Tax=Microbulbifer sp. JMSA008 TaxID=3243373 RepID=UPI004039538D